MGLNYSVKSCSTSPELFDFSIASPIAMLDRNLKYLSVSQQWLSAYGFSRAQEVVGRHHHDIFTHTSDTWQTAYHRCLVKGEEAWVEHWEHRADGTRQLAQSVMQAWLTTTGAIGGVMISSQFTAATAIQSYRQLANQKFQTLTTLRKINQYRVAMPTQPIVSPRLEAQNIASFMQRSSLAMIEWDCHFRVITWNQAAEKIFGYTPAEAKGKLLLALILPANARVAAYQTWQARLTEISGTQSIHKNCTKAGRIVTCEWHTTPLINPEGQVSGLVSMIVDISDRLQSETNLQYNQKLITDIINNTDSCIFVKDYLKADGKYILSNQQFANLCDRTCEQVLGKNDYDLFEPHIADAFQIVDRQVLQTGKPMQIEEVAPQADGLHTSIVFKFPLLNPSGEVYAVGGIAADITDRKRAEAALKAVNEQLELRIQERTATLQQSEAQLKQYVHQLQEEAAERQAALRELKHTQAQLVQTEKMSSLGQLVAGVAHEINNPVNFIYGNISPASEHVQDLIRLIHHYQQHCIDHMPEMKAIAEEIDLSFILEDLPKLLASMRVGADRIRKIVLALRTFSRMDESEVKFVDIHEGIDSTLMILQSRIKEVSKTVEIAVIKSYGDLPLVECYAGQLNQVFMNILANAIDALQENAEPKTLPDSALPATPAVNYDSTDGCRRTSPTIRIQTEALVNHVVIRISDNGAGIPEVVRQKLFEPFFTTKPVGKGTGLGLSISYQVVVDRHGGDLHCVSSLGHGTEFVIKIPKQLNLE